MNLDIPATIRSLLLAVVAGMAWTAATVQASFPTPYTPASGDSSQIDGIETPGVALVTGQAKTTATVLVDGTAPADRQDERFAHPVSVDNSDGAALAEIPVSAEEGMDTDYATVKKLVPEENIFYSYDADGNLVSDGFFSYVWDAENRLLSVETLSGAAPAGVAEVKVEYAYDYAGRRVVRKAYRKVPGSWTLQEEQRFVHDGFNIVGEWNGAGDLMRTFLWGADLSGSPGGAGGAGGLVSLAEHSGMSPTAHFASYDGGGNLIALTDASDGEASALYEYDPYGNLLASSGPMAEANPFRFGTQWRDHATELDLYHYRVYDPVHGRWLGRDPLGEAGGLNLYGFLGNAPVGNADVLGLDAFLQDFNRVGEILVAFDTDHNGAANVTPAEYAALRAFVDNQSRITRGFQNLAFGTNVNGGISADEATLRGFFSSNSVLSYELSLQERAHGDVPEGTLRLATAALINEKRLSLALASLGIDESARQEYLGQYLGALIGLGEAMSFDMLLAVSGRIKNDPCFGERYAENNLVRMIDPSELRWTQTTAGGNGRAAIIRESMSINGWAGGAIDVVRTADGLATLDHTRAAVALELGIGKIPVRIHAPSDPLPIEMLSRPWNRAGDTAATWGEAVRLRGGGQIPPIGPTGSSIPPRLPRR